MRIPLSILVITSILVLGGQPGVLAQWTSSKVQVRGMFGDRTLGETLKPRPSQFGNSVWRGPSGNFLGRDAHARGMMFPAPPPLVEFLPLRMPPRVLTEPPVPIQPAVPALQPQPGGGAEFERMPDIWIRSKSVPQGADAAGVVPQAVVPGGGTATRLAPQLSGGFAIGAPRMGSVDYYLSNGLEAQITKIPRFKTDSPITVSVAGGTATLQGTVSTPSDRNVLAEFIRLEPGVWNVNNQLTVKPSE